MEPKKIATSELLERHLGLVQAGGPVTIDITTPAGQKNKFRTTFIGFLPKHYVLIQFPDANKLGNFARFITQGAGITVRGLVEGQEGAVIAFVSSVKQTLQIPSRIIVLDFPRHVSIQRLRTTKRLDTNITVKVNIEKEYWQGTITDLSPTGCQLLINNSDSLLLAESSPIEIIIEEFNNIQNLRLPSSVCSIRRRSNSTAFGCQFSDEAQAGATKLIQEIIFVEE